MSKLDTIFNVVQEKLNAGELTLEAANEVYNKAIEKYTSESEEDDIQTVVDESAENLELEDIAEYLENTKSEIHRAYFDNEITLEDAQELLSFIDVDNYMFEAADDNDIPESAKKDIDPNSKKKDLAKKAALGAAAIGTVVGAAGVAYGIKKGKIDKNTPGKIKDAAVNAAKTVNNKIVDAQSKPVEKKYNKALDELASGNNKKKVIKQVSSASAKLQKLASKRK